MYATTMQAYKQYETSQAHTADGGELIVMLYQGALRFLARASTTLQAGNLQESHDNLIRCQDIIAELMGSLDLSAGDIAYNLYRIYEYMYHRLVQANLHKDAKPLDEVARLLRELLPAWQQAAKEARLQGRKVGELAGSRLSYVAV